MSQTIKERNNLMHLQKNVSLDQERTKYLFEGAQCFVNIMEAEKFPKYFKQAKGAHIWDVDNNKYIDLFLGSGTIILGHGYEQQINEVIKQLNSGASLSMRNPAEIEIAKWLSQRISFAKRTLFFKTGSEATFTAIRFAYTVSKKDIVISLGYHGWLPPFNNNFGEQVSLVNIDNYDKKAVEEAVEKYRNRIAAIIVTPNTQNFSKDFYEFLQETSEKNKALFIVDEVKIGFRAKFPCFSEYNGLKPDICLFAKALSNGFPISCLVCTEEVYQQLNYYNFSTYAGEPLSMVATITNLRLLEQGKYDDYDKYSRYFFDNLQKTLEGSQIKVKGISTFIKLVYPSNNFANIFVQKLATEGVLVHPEGEIILSASHDFSIIDEVIEKIKYVVKELSF